MMKKFKQSLREMLKDPPGERFQLRYKRQRHARTRTMVKVLVMLCGMLLVLVGLFFMVVPGPGLPIVALGGAMVANESLVVARLLDAIELKLRRLYAAVRGRKPPTGHPE